MEQKSSKGLKMRFIILFSISLFLFGCSVAPVNQITKLTGEKQALADIKSPGMKAGDHVQVLKKVCRDVYRKDIPSQKCSETFVGKALILEFSSGNQALIQAEEGTVLESGLLLEKIE